MRYYNLFTRETQNVYANFGKLKNPKVERDLHEKGKNTWKLEETQKKKVLISTPKINEIIARPQIVKLANIYDSNRIALEKSMKLTEKLISKFPTQDSFPLNDVIMHSNIIDNIA